jgi:heterotetrameric sarcosine oxidase gamma subunit
VVELSWTATTPLSRIYSPGSHGATKTPARLSMAELTDFELVQVMARRGLWSPTDQACKEAYGQPAPAKPQAISAEGALLIWSGPDQFLILSPRGSSLERARLAFAGMASLSEQSDGRSLLRLSGARVRDMLAKVCSLDLHPGVFPVGAAAATSIDHTSVNLWRSEDSASGEAVFCLLIFSTFAESLWHTLLDSGAEYGISIGAVTAWQG